MFVDASAIVAILTREDDEPELIERLRGAGPKTTSGVAVYEAVLALARKTEGSLTAAVEQVDAFLDLTETQVVAMPPMVGRDAVAAFESYGKRRHPANLNMGDCFAYAMAKHLNVPLLYKGDDFAKTDLA